MEGTPSKGFINKLYNIISYKEDQINDIKEIEQKIAVEYNGDLQLAKS